MAVLVMVYGHSGSGKSASLRNFDPEQVEVINVLGKTIDDYYFAPRADEEPERQRPDEVHTVCWGD